MYKYMYMYMYVVRECTPSSSLFPACLALPKMNLQFLTLHDYLLRNYTLFRLESTCTSLHHSLFTVLMYNILVCSCFVSLRVDILLCNNE